MDWYVVNINPEPWAVGEATVFRRGGKLSATVGPNTQLREFKEAVRAELEAQPHKTYQGPVHIVMYFWRQNAQWINPDGTTNSRNRPDVTNMLKATEDAMQGVLFKNDREVVHSEPMLVQAGPDIVGRILIGIEEDSFPPSAFVRIPTEAQKALRQAVVEQRSTEIKADLEWGGDDDPF